MMNNNGRKKIWFTIEEFRAQLVTDIKACKIEVEGSSKPLSGYEVSIRHPNTREVLESRKIPVSELKDKNSPWDELAGIGTIMKSAITVETGLQEPIKRPPAPKKGKMNTSNIINH